MQNTSNTDTVNNNRNLIPFAEFDSAGEQKWGYLDEETGEIIIEAQYVYVSPFVGNFAIVKNDWHDSKKIINKDGRLVFTGQFDNVYFITSENGKSTVAILEKQYTRTKFQVGLGILGSSPDTGFYSEEYHKYRMINPATGKTIIPEKEIYLIYRIEPVGDYLIVGTDLYQFLDNGDIKCVAENDTALAVSILKDYFTQRGINALVKGHYTTIEIDYWPYIREKYADPDLSGAFQSLPPEFDIPFERYEPFYRDPREFLNSSFEIPERKYLLEFTNDETGKRAMGIYNESKAEWELWPFLSIQFDTTTTLFYIVDILKTNNPNLYRIGLSNDDIGWARGRHALLAGGIYSTSEHDFMHNLYLYEDYPPQPTILMMGGSDQRYIKFPEYGVYYRDYSRIAAQEPPSQEPENSQKQILSHSCYVQAVGFSPDGKTVISGDRDGIVIFWNTESGGITRILPGIRTGWDMGISCMAVSPDAKNIAFGSHDKTVRIWNAESEQITTLRGHTNWVESIAFSPDGKTVVSGQDYNRWGSDEDIHIILWDVEGKEKIRAFVSQEEDVHKNTLSVAVSPDGKYIISGDSFDRIKLWDAKSGELIRSTQGLKGSLLTVSPDGKNIASVDAYSENETIVLLDIKSGEKIKVFNGHTADVKSIAFSPDGKTIVSGDRDGTIIFWDVESGSRIRAFKGHADTVFSIAFSPDGKTIVTGGGTGEVKLWNTADGGLIRTFGGNK